MLGIAYIRYPLPIARHVHMAGGNSRQIRNELARPALIVHQFTAQLLSDGKELFSLGARQRPSELQRSGGKPHRRSVRPLQEPCLFLKRPEVRPAVPGGLKHIVLAVRSPLSAALLGRLVPVLKQGTEARAVDS